MLSYTFLLRWFAGLCCAVVLVSHAAAQPPILSAQSWLLLDTNSGVTLASHEPDRRLQPGSLAQLMTAFVVFVALGEQRIALEDRVTVSPGAFAAPGRDGARMFIEPGAAVTVAELLRGLIVSSGSDAAVALAEHTAGSQAAFVDRMNAEVRRLGLVDTHFANPTGLADTQQYSTARDLARLTRRLRSDFPQFLPLFREREFTYNHIGLATQNRLLWSDPAVDGMKTGQLDSSGWSIVASATRPRGSTSGTWDRTLVAVVLGAPNDGVRAQEALRLLNHGFVEYDTVRLFRGAQILSRAEVLKGERSELPIGPEADVFVTVSASERQQLVDRALRTEIERTDPLLAPLTKGEPVGRLKISVPGKVLADVPVVALESVPPAGLFGRAYDAVRLWWRRRN